MAAYGRVLLVFNFTPNIDGGNYFFPDGETNVYNWGKKYASHLASEYETTLLNAGSYHVYGDFIDIGNLVNISARDLYLLTYIAVYPNTEDDIIRFYYVNEITPQSNGCLRAYITLDEWGTYIGGARIDHLHIKKTNFKIFDKTTNWRRTPLYFTDPCNCDLGRYDFLGAFTGTRNGRQLSRKNLAIAATIKHQVYKDLQVALEEMHTYIFDMDDFPDTEAGFQQLLDIVSSIYEVKDDSLFGNGKAEVVHLYIINESDTFGGRARAVQFKGLYQNTITPITGVELGCGIKDYDIKLYNTSYEDTGVPVNLVKIEWLGRDIYFGTKYNGIKLPYFVGEFTVRFRICTNNNGIQFLVQAGEEIRDITSSFEVTIIANTATLTAGESISKAMSNMSNLAGGAFQIAAGGAGLVSGGLQVSNTVANFFNNGNGSYIPGGDGLATFNDIIKNHGSADYGWGDYLWLCIYNVNVNSRVEAEKVNNYGAYCEYTLASENQTINDCFAGGGVPLIGIPVTNYFLACESCVKNVPYNACAVIRAKFSEGVHLELL